MQDRKGSPTATKYWEAIRVFQLANLQKKDVFCDLGCGYGFVCIWASRRCKLAVGIEEDPKRARRARKITRVVDSDALHDYERDFGRCFRRSSK
jgi:predicted RNA methylase